MAKKLEVYKCEICGNIVEVFNAGDGELVCCNQSMKRLEEKTADAKTEKHVPVIEKTDSGYKVKVGSIPHPMEPKHYIQWIELLADGKSYFQFLEPGKPAEAVFCVTAENVSAREYCNVHGLWKG
ncbi:MAG: desulfoferrodoxin [Sedimentisphaerales bacterium]|nr:desulfoferrodoxin [Sedimentisphaerales bacterium]